MIGDHDSPIPRRSKTLEGAPRQANCAGGTAFDAVADALRDWEPRLDLLTLRSEARLYDPDGTLYAICLSDQTTLATERRRQVIARGELVAVPRSYAVEVDPSADFLAIRHDGPTPYHFRERFLQIWGFEHFPLPPSDAVVERRAELIPDTDRRHRIHYAVTDHRGESYSVERPATIPGNALEMRLLLVLEGQARIVLEDSPSSQVLAQHGLAAIGPGRTFRVEGCARFGLIRLACELEYEARCARGPRSAEWTQPPTSRES